MHSRPSAHHWYLNLCLVFVLSLTLLQSSRVRGQFQPSIEPPELLFPPDGQVTTVSSHPPLGIPTFTWRSVVGATLYHLQINSDPLFTSPNLLEIYTPNTQYTPTTIEPFIDGIYYWRVRVEEPLPGSNFSDPYQFQKSWASLLNSPNLTAPADGETLAFFDEPAFSWEIIPGAAMYRIQIAASADSFDDPVYIQDTAANHHQPVYKLANGEYYWRILPIDPAGSAGTPSMVRSFTLAYGSSTLGQIPTLISPDHNDTLSFTPTFQWSAIPGAQVYQLEYTTGPSCDFITATRIETAQTSYTSPENFLSPAMFCWRVRVNSGLSISDWSETRSFTLLWNQATRLLTPTYAYPYTRTPVFSWSPVPGAAYYQVRLDETASHTTSDFQGETSNPFWISPVELPYTEYTWQVIPFDYNGQAGKPSQVAIFQNPLSATVPALVYPQYYYPPNDPLLPENVNLNPREDRTAPYPVFIWQRVFNPPPNGGLLARAYRIQVSLNPYFSPLEWQLDTQNTAASPTLEAPFIPLPNIDYYWRVCPLDPVLPTQCLVDLTSQTALWSQIWITRFDPALAQPPSSDLAPQLLRPSHGHEQVENTPLFEWLPLASAAHYQIQISRDPNFTSLEHQDYSIIPCYASPVSLAQRNLSKTDYGTFYWRVRGFVDGEYSDWSAAWRFQIASQSEWRRVRYLGESNNRLLVGRDPVADTSLNFDLSTLYVAQANTAWFIGFNANTDPVIDKTYVIYLDTDHVDGSGGSAPPERGYAVTTVPAHQPEYVLYIDQISGQITAQNTWIYTWAGSSWSYGQTLLSRGGALVYTPGTPGYLEIELPDIAINLNQAPDSIALMVFSVNTSGIVLDSVPEDPNVPGSAALSRFTSASDRMNLIFPSNNAVGYLASIPSLPPFFWDWPTGANPTANDIAPPTPYAGAQLQIATDPGFNIIVADITSTSTAPYLGTPGTTVADDLMGNTSYYWRVRPRYLNAGIFFGAWSETRGLTRTGFTPQNLNTSTNLSTPEFRWDMAEGTSQYQFQLSNQPDFDPTVLDITTANIAYTPLTSLAPGNYFWRAGIIRQGLSQAAWSTVQEYSLQLPPPIGLTPDDPTQPINVIPTLCWQPWLITSDAIPIASAWKYRIQISQSSSFSSIYASVENEMHCWTPQSWYPQGTYYWRVAAVDSAGHVGNYSTPATFVLRYTIPALVSPVLGWISHTPTFIWTPVPGMTGYRLEVSLEADFSPLLDWVETVSTIYTPVIAYPLEGTIYWRVSATNLDGFQSGFASTYTTIDSPDVWLPIIGK